MYRPSTLEQLLSGSNRTIVGLKHEVADLFDLSRCAAIAPLWD
jgi:hypothetical protein